jgi:hypothetical protein
MPGALTSPRPALFSIIIIIIIITIVVAIVILQHSDQA